VTRVLGLVPARSGSKGVPGKNLRPLAGLPLIEYAARAGHASGVLDRIVLSTDSAAIADAGRRAGLEVPFMRPPELAADDSPMLAVIRHALAALDASGWSADVLVLLQPTSPLRTPRHVRDAVTLLGETNADSVVTVLEVPRHLSPDYVMRIEHGMLRPFLPDGARITRRQDARPAYAREGTVYTCWRRTIETFGNIYGDDCRPLLIAPAESLSIDSPADWDEAERRLAGTRRAGIGEGAPAGSDSR
jgi:CMP-N,N'-diacetyllegionaminic acid synthase